MSFEFYHHVLLWTKAHYILVSLRECILRDKYYGCVFFSFSSFSLTKLQKINKLISSRHDILNFQVSLEQSPSEVFIHVSAARCWEMVRDRVNQEIAKQHKLGRTNLPPLQPPGSLDGFEMFGFSSPAIVQVN